MARIVGGFSSSHTPLMSLPGELWGEYARNDANIRDLVQPPDCRRVTYQELLASADPAIAKAINVETFKRRAEAIQKGLNELQRRFEETNPDVVVMFGDDQEEVFFYDNYPTINVYWGETYKMLPRPIRPDMTEAAKISALAYGTDERDYPVDAELGLHLIGSLIDQDFDVAHSRYQKGEYGGTVGPANWYLDHQRTTASRPFGLAHAFAFPICRWFGGRSIPMVPISINTCYPPNWIGPRRAYALGRAVRKALAAWNSDKRVAIVTSGGLSHFVVDEELDRAALKALAEADGEALSALPRTRLQSATTEILNWVAAAGAMGDTRMEVLTYEAGYRTAAGTGCGCAVGHWH